ncbi:MAG: HK97-gp10 family putative phage morphogenesis protein [Methylocystis sp.]|uniref:HK97-gp10 family putative phage morphogenesis protein n=1 Tax=Methylocystis sp. TaxID=1911079 RepID=UPI003DA69A86
MTFRLNTIDEKTVRMVGAALFAGGDEIRAEAAHMITEGAVSGKYHVPSLPGHPPLEDTGVLRTHIETTQVAPLRVEVSSNAPYAVALEVGTSKMAARPYMGPASRNMKKEVIARVKSAIDAAVKG